MKGLLLVILLVASVSGQDVQIKRVYDFSGGLVNSISNAAMNDNMAKVLLNYDIDPYGNLKRRQGLVYSDTNVNIGYVYAIMPYVTKDHRQLLFLAENSKENWDADNKTTEIIKCDMATGTCSTMLDRGYYYPTSDWTVPYNFSHFVYRDTLYFGSTNGEMVYWAGDSIVTLRKTQRGDTTQVRALALNSNGSLNDKYQYIIVQKHGDSTYGFPADRYRECSTVVNVPCWFVYPHYGTVLIYDLSLPWDSCTGSFVVGEQPPYDSLIVYRRSSVTDSFLRVGGINNYFDSNIAYEDTTFTPLDDTLFMTYGSGPPDSICEDSILSFQPASLELFGDRIYAIGDPEHSNRLYFSNYDNPTNWPCSNYLNIPASEPDWFVDLLALEDRLILFRQNSVLQLQGYSYYQYSIDELIANVGLTAPRSVARVGNTIYFYHSTGVYTLSAFGGISETPITFSIQKSLDSFMVSQQRAVGAAIAGEYWLSIDYSSGYQTTYIYSEIPIPHWRSYDFGIHAVVQFDPDTIIGNFNPNHWLIALVSHGADRSIFYNWRRDEISGSFENKDTIDIGYLGTVAYYPIIATYQSKRFFEGRERERIHWIDIVGEGTCSTITFTFLDEGTPFDTVAFQPDFTDNKRDRIIVDHIVTDFAVRWQDNGYGQYRIKGYEIGWVSWDKGRPVP